MASASSPAKCPTAVRDSKDPTRTWQRRRCLRRRRGALLDVLDVVLALHRCRRRLELDVTSETGEDGAGHHGVGDDAFVGPPFGGLDREQRIGSLRLSVGAKRVVVAERVVDVVEYDG